MDHAGEELERSAKLLRRPVARAYGQARKVGIMQSRILLRGYAREGEMPPSLATHPQNQQQNQQQNQGRLHRGLDTPFSTETGSSKSPLATSAPRGVGVPSFRTSRRMSALRFCSSFTTSAPTLPVPPITRIFIAPPCLCAPSLFRSAVRRSMDRCFFPNYSSSIGAR